MLRNHTGAEKRADEMAADAFIAPINENLKHNIIPYIENNPDTEFIIFFPPYSILFWDDVITENRLTATLNAYRTVENALNGYENVKMFFFPSESVVTDLNNYADYTHYHPGINRYMAECFVNGTDYIAKENEDGKHIEDYISDMQGIIERYDFDSLNEKLLSYR